MRALIVIVAAALVGCAGPKYRFAVVEPDPTRYEEVGYAEADATGLLILGFIKRRLSNTIERAVEEAIASQDGDEMVDITVQESWWTAIYVQGFKVHVHGKVLRRVGGEAADERERRRIQRELERNDLPETERRRRGIDDD